MTHPSPQAYWEALDLSYLADTMTSAAYPLPRWQVQDALRALKHYKNFLWLHTLYPNTTFVPSKEIDECWHNHILHTEHYMQDCQQLFGRYLHHAPATPGKDDETLIANYLRTKELYRKVFNIDLSDPAP
jgi:hypothetical protein